MSLTAQERALIIAFASMNANVSGKMARSGKSLQAGLTFMITQFLDGCASSRDV